MQTYPGMARGKEQSISAADSHVIGESCRRHSRAVGAASVPCRDIGAAFSTVAMPGAGVSHRPLAATARTRTRRAQTTQKRLTAKNQRRKGMEIYCALIAKIQLQA